jgi:hypothetical protein
MLTEQILGGFSVVNEWEDDPEDPKPPMTPERLAFLITVGAILFAIMVSYW